MSTAAADPITPEVRPPRVALAAALCLALSGCLRPEPSLRVATDLAPTERQWLERYVPVHDPSVRWTTVEPGIDPAGLAGQADLILRSRPIPNGRPNPRLHWSTGPSRFVGLRLNEGVLGSRAMIGPDSVEALTAPAWAGLLALDDPRRDAATAALARHILARQGWGTGYGSLVELAGRSTTIGRGDSGPARITRGEAAACPVLVPVREDADLALGDGPALEVGVVEDSPHAALARQWQSRLAAGPSTTGAATEDAGLALDLVGATLVDSHEELSRAVAAVSSRSSLEAARLKDSLHEAPPWPPASVTALKSIDADGSLLDSLAEQVAPGLEARYWLLQSWERPARPLDAETFANINAAAGGRLAKDERFRAWLRADWVAWARQRYRWVARQAAAPPGPRS